MSGREAVLNKVRGAMRAGGYPLQRQRAVDQRLGDAPVGVIPARGKLEPAARIDLFCKLAEKVSASIARVDARVAVPEAVMAYLRSKNLSPAIRIGADPRLSAMPWAEQKTLDIRRGASDGHDEVGVSHAFAGVAETGTVVMVSGPDNPTTLNFLPDHHIVVIEAKDIVGDVESALSQLRKAFGKGTMPRTLNFITGPSRSADIEQTLLLGAHGPRALHLIVVGG